MLQPLVFQSKPGESATAYSGERLINLFSRPATGVSQLVLIGRSGMVEYANLGTSDPVRAMTTMGGNIYAASGGFVWKYDGSTRTRMGALPDGATSAAANYTQAAFVVDGRYFLTDGTTLTEYTPGVLTSAYDVAEKDGYFVLVGSDGNRDDAVQVSNLNDGTSFDALDFAFAEENADAAVAVVRDHSQFYVLGTETMQPFYNIGGADFPFAPNVNGIVEHGCKTKLSVATADNAIFWVRVDGAVMRYAGASPEVISPAEIWEAIKTSTITAALTFTDRGAEFYAICRENDTTLVYDMVTGLWHERAYGLEYEPWKGLQSTTLAGVEYIGTTDGRIATLDADRFTDFGNVMLAEAVSQPVEQMGNRFSVSKVHMNIRGNGTIDRSSKAMLQTSRDGLKWGVEKERRLGLSGQYWLRAAWHGLGMFRRFQVRLRITDNVPRDIYGVSYE